MGGMHSTTYEPHFETIKTWPWSRTKVILTQFKEGDYEYSMSAREVSNLTGLHFAEAENFLLSFSKDGATYVNSMTILLSCLLLSDGMNKMETTRIDAVFDLFDFTGSGKATLDDVTVMLICLGFTLSGILKCEEGVDEAKIVDFATNMFGSMEKSVFDIGESISREEFHELAMKTWTDMDDQTIENLFEMWKPELVVSDVNESASEHREAAKKAHQYASKNKEGIQKIHDAVKEYHSSLETAMRLKHKFENAVKRWSDDENRTTLIVRLQRFKDLKNCLKRVLDADSKFSCEFNSHLEAPEELTRALKLFHDQRLDQQREIEQIVQDAEKDGIAQQINDVLGAISPEEIKGVLGIDSTDESILDSLVHKFDELDNLGVFDDLASEGSYSHSDGSYTDRSSYTGTEISTVPPKTPDRARNGE